MSKCIKNAFRLEWLLQVGRYQKEDLGGKIGYNGGGKHNYDGGGNHTSKCAALPAGHFLVFEFR